MQATQAQTGNQKDAAFSLVVRPGTKNHGLGQRSTFCKIEYDGSRLSITGVEGPQRGGNCSGGCGQINPVQVDQLADGWTPELLARFNEVWDRWHLNDMRAACEHQRDLGWQEQARESVTLYHFTLTDEALQLKKAAEKAALDALHKGETFTPTAEQSKLASLPYSMTHHEENLRADLGLYYRPKRPIFNGDKGATETKTRGWLSESEHPLGLLSKPCPVCNYKYGSAWLSEDVPADVIEFLRSLPKSDMTPAWV